LYLAHKEGIMHLRSCGSAHKGRQRRQ